MWLYRAMQNFDPITRTLIGSSSVVVSGASESDDVLVDPNMLVYHVVGLSYWYSTVMERCKYRAPPPAIPPPSYRIFVYANKIAHVSMPCY